jgi:hypothetical protein
VAAGEQLIQASNCWRWEKAAKPNLEDKMFPPDRQYLLMQKAKSMKRIY